MGGLRDSAPRTLLCEQWHEPFDRGLLQPPDRPVNETFVLLLRCAAQTHFEMGKNHVEFPFEWVRDLSCGHAYE